MCFCWATPTQHPHTHGLRWMRTEPLREAPCVDKYIYNHSIITIYPTAAPIIAYVTGQQIPAKICPKAPVYSTGQSIDTLIRTQRIHTHAADEQKQTVWNKYNIVSLKLCYWGLELVSFAQLWQRRKSCCPRSGDDAFPPADLTAGWWYEHPEQQGERDNATFPQRAARYRMFADSDINGCISTPIFHKLTASK